MAAWTTAVGMPGSALIGGSLGLLLGSQGDILFGVDTQIVGVVVGAVIGSLLPRSRALGSVVHAAAAGAGVALPALAFVGRGRVTPEVLWTMTAIAIIGSGMIDTVIRRVEQRR